MQAPLAGRTALVTGAGHGIGSATATLFAEQGAAVVLADIDPDALSAAQERLTAAGHHAVALAGDLTDPGLPDRLVRLAIEETGGLDIVVPAAGYNHNAAAIRMDDTTWQRMLDIHVTATFRLLRAAGVHFAEAAEQERAAGDERFRKVVTVSSIAFMGSAFQSNYAAAKAAVVGLSKSLSKEWAAMRVNVNSVAFGSIDTRLIAPRTPDNIADLGVETLQLGMSPRTRQQVIEDIGFGRAGTPQEAAGAIFLLCTPWSDWVTGQNLVVSGGQIFGMSA